MVFGGLFLLLFWFVYGILIFFIPFILYAIMKNTKRTADLLDQIKSLLPTPPKDLEAPALPRQTFGSFLFEKPASAPSNTLHEAAREPRKFTTLKLGSTYNETDEGIDPGPG